MKKKNSIKVSLIFILFLGMYGVLPIRNYTVTENVQPENLILIAEMILYAKQRDRRSTITC